MTWIGAWTIRLVAVFVGIFCLMLAMDILGLNKADNPFTSWSGFFQCLALALGVGLLLGIEALVEHMGWQIGPPFHVSGAGPDRPPKEPPA
jgi:hypothetical protein